MKREETTFQKVFEPFKIVIETARERDILSRLVGRSSESAIIEIASTWPIALSEVRFVLNTFTDLLREKEGS